MPARPGHDAHDQGPGAGARHLPPRRRRVPRPRALPRRLGARLPRHDRRGPLGQRHAGQRGGQRRRRRQARLHLPARPDPLLPRRGAGAPQRRHLALRRRRRPRGGPGPSRRAGAQAGRRLGRQGHRHRSAGHQGGARRTARQGAGRPALVDRPAGGPALDRPDLRRRRARAAARRPAPLRRQRRQPGVGAPRRTDPRRARQGRADRELLARRWLQGHLGARRPAQPRGAAPRARAGAAGGP